MTIHHEEARTTDSVYIFIQLWKSSYRMLKYIYITFIENLAHEEDISRPKDLCIIYCLSQIIFPSLIFVSF